jgi:fermentation-respiration switch protein FrsA (DUF1100 family)
MLTKLSLRGIKLRVTAAVVTAVLLASGCAGLAQKERELTFRPLREVAGWFGGVPAAVQELYLPVANGEATDRMHAWWWPATDPDAPVVFYLHGARWNLTGHLTRISQLRDFGFSVFAIDYRGFGKSDGEVPSEESVYQDARVGWAWLAERQPDPSRRYIYGHSLGGAVAVDLAVELSRDVPAAQGLIVESSFTSLADMATELTNGLIPAGLVLTQKFDSLAKIGQVRMPVLVVHGTGDRYVPPRFSEALYEAAPAPKKLLLVENGSHNNSMWTGASAYRQAIGELFGLPRPTRSGVAEYRDASASSATGGERGVNRARGLGVSSNMIRETE